VSAGRVLLWVQHMLGIGHVRRAALVSRAMAEAGLAVRFVTGGMPAPGIDPGTRDVVQLPPVRSADERFSAYLDEQGAPIDDAWRARRRYALLAFEQDGADAAAGAVGGHLLALLLGMRAVRRHGRDQRRGNRELFHYSPLMRMKLMVANLTERMGAGQSVSASNRATNQNALRAVLPPGTNSSMTPWASCGAMPMAPLALRR